MRTNNYRKNKSSGGLIIVGLLAIFLIVIIFINRDEGVEKPYMVKITDTPTNSLNIREEAEGGSEILGEAKPGEEYLATDKDGTWLKIEKDGQVLGWVSSKYTEELAKE